MKTLKSNDTRRIKAVSRNVGNSFSWGNSRFVHFSREVADPGPLGKQPADQQTQRYRGLFEQLNDDARFSTLRLPVCRLQRPIVISIQEEERVAAGHRLEDLGYHESKLK